MDVRNVLDQIKKRAFDRITEAVNTSDTAEISKLARIAEEADRLISSQQEIEDATSRLESRLNAEQEYHPTVSLSSRQRGETLRRDFVQKMRSKGFVFVRDKGAIYRLQSGELFPIAASTEPLPDQWFLGTKDHDFALVVLLCETERNGVLEFILSKDFLTRVWNRLSRDRRGQVKFSVHKKSEGYYLSIPGIGRQRIDDYIQRYEPFESEGQGETSEA